MTSYVVSVSPVVSQVMAAELHLSHSLEGEGSSVHVPRLPVRTPPTWGAPLTDGGGSGADGGANPVGPGVS